MKAVAPHALGINRRVHRVTELSGGAFIVRMERNGIDFDPGQYIAVGVLGDIDAREYSIYSAPQDDWLEILVKEVEGGFVSPKLHALEPNAQLYVDGPFGFFTIAEPQRHDARYLFVATGTGISPFHCFTRAYPQIDYTLIHGVRRSNERYEMESFDHNRYVACLSREAGGDYSGRVTDYLRENPVEPDTLCYLCGNCDMIYEVFDILKDQGVSPEQLFAEVYF